MIIFKDTELGDLNISLNTLPEIRLLGRVFNKEQVLSKKLESQIPQIIKNYISQESEFFVVEHKSYFSIWVEKIIENTNKAIEIENKEPIENQQLDKKISTQYR